MELWANIYVNSFLEKETIRKENIAGDNTVTDHSEKETEESVIDRENDELNSLFIEALNHEKEKKRVARKSKQDTKSKDDKFLTLCKMNLQMFREVEEGRAFFVSLSVPSL